MKDTSILTGNGIRTGAQYISGLQDDREVWTQGKRIKDVTSEPGMSRGASSLAGFLDKQHDKKYQDKITYVDEDGIRCPLSFKTPKSKQDILDRGKAYYEWATWSHGMFGRTPDYKNASLMSFSAARSFLDKGTVGKAEFSQNMRDQGIFFSGNKILHNLSCTEHTQADVDASIEAAGNALEQMSKKTRV